MNQRAGIFVQQLSGDAAYQSFRPAPLPPTPPIQLNGPVTETLVRATARLAVLNSVAQRIPNINLFVSMYIRKEALMSSQIEGTQATLEDVLDPDIDQNSNRDVADVINYVRATEYAIGRLAELPLSVRLIRETHSVLMTGVRGQERTPGDFRHSQNWIGGPGSTLRTARFIPPTPDDMLQAMSDLEKYINTGDNLDPLIKTGLIHYQFETIHPFLDGNGRLGRLLITLFLIEQGLLSTPALYISYFLKRNRLEYYERLTAVRQTGDYEQWIRFFLEAVEDAATDAVATIDKLVSLHDRSSAAVASLGRATPTATKLLAYLEAHPIIDIGRTAEALGMAFSTVAAAVNRLSDLGILAQTGGGARRRTFSYLAYLDILREGTQ